ncbi:serine/threonine-protein kinase [Streptodolium elevatio]|uniref:non-specific serine/threonine protein kinase n=1 Tax=Streptodolium elevatio TaxID=3157996 RepID=A0ABV3DIA0_9ACTN
MNGDAANSRRVGDGRFELVERLGRGAMGTVWRAVDTTLHREVAIKEVRVREDAPADQIALLHARVLREAQALARLRNPHVATVHQIVDDEPFPWIVMELVPGQPLTSLLAEGTLTPHDAAGVAADILEALTAAHDAGVLHRDVKPANVLIRPDGAAVLVDFGIAAVEGTATVTGTGSFVGTIEYIAPERTEGRRPTPASDLWSLGVLLYVAVEGYSPFRRPNDWATITAIVNDPHAPPRRAGELTDVIDALLAKDPRHRPTAAELAPRLAAIAGRTAGTAGTAGTAPSGGTREVPDAVEPSADPIAATGTPAAPRPDVLPTVTGGPPPDPGTPPGNGTLPGAGTTAPRDPAPPRPGRVRRVILAVAVGAVLAGGGTAAGLMLADGDDEGAKSQGPPTPTAPGTSSGSAPSAPPSSRTSPAPVPDSRPAVPEGFKRQTDTEGIEVAVPANWRLGRDDSGDIAYKSPDGRYLIVVRALRGDTADPFAEQSASATETKASPSYPGYEQLTLSRRSDPGDSAAVWDYRYRAPDGPRAVRDIRWRSGDNSYNLWVVGPETDDWSQYEDLLDVAVEQFRDTRAG